jgi:hypothetical protein
MCLLRKSSFALILSCLVRISKSKIRNYVIAQGYTEVSRMTFAADLSHIQFWREDFSPENRFF